MLFYKLIFIKIIYSIILSSSIVSSVLYIFSIIELLGDTYKFKSTIILGLINTLELLITIPIIIFIISLILFWNNIKKTNELLIIRHYLSLNKIMMIFSIFIIIFTYFEINKTDLNNKVVDFKENYLKKMDNNNSRKIFFSFNEDKFKITRFDGINLVKKSVEEISVYEFKNNIFLNSLYSDINQIDNNKIIMKNPKVITPYTIRNLANEVSIDLYEFGENFYNNEYKINLYKNNNMKNDIELRKKFNFIVILFTYVSLFLSKKAIQMNSSVLKYSLISLLIFIYAFVTSNTYLDSYNSIFQISVLLTFTFYLYKNLINE